MHGKLKILLLLFVVVTAAGCAGVRKAIKPTATTMPAALDYDMVINDVGVNNITEKGFIIRKGRLELEGTGLDGSYGFNARLNSKGNLVASVKGPMGLEVVRIIIVDNDVCIVDRMGKVAYVGKKSSFMEKNGFPEGMIKTLFGDISVSKPWKSDTLINRELVISEVRENYTKETGISIDEMKVCMERYSFGQEDEEVLFNYGSFRTSEDNKYASEIVIIERQRKILIRLTIEDIEVGFEEDIPFAVPSYRRKSI